MHRGLSLSGHEVLIALNSVTVETFQVRQQTIWMQTQPQLDIILQPQELKGAATVP